MADTLSSINVDKLTSSVNDAVGGGAFEMSQTETSEGTPVPQVSSASSPQTTTPVLPKGIYSLTPTLTPRLATMNQLFQLSRALSINVGQTCPVTMVTQASIQPGTPSDAAVSTATSFVPKTQYASVPSVSSDSVAQGQLYPMGQCLGGVQSPSCLVKQQESFTGIRNAPLTSGFQSKVPDLGPSVNVPISESSSPEINMNETLSSVPGFGMMNKPSGAYSFPLTYFHPLSPTSQGTVSYSLPSTVFGQPAVTQTLSPTLTTTTVTLASNLPSVSSTTSPIQGTAHSSTAPLCISPISPANSPVMSAQPSIHNLNISSLPFMLSWQVAERQSESADKTASRTVSPADPNRLTPFTTHFPISLPVLTASDRQLIQQLPLSGEELSTPTESNGAFAQENQLIVNSSHQENHLSDGHQQTDSHSELYSHSANEVHSSSNLDQSEVNKTGLGMALSLLSQSNQQDQSSNCQPSVTMAMNLLAQVAHSESQSQSVDCQPNVTLAMSLLNQVSNANVIPHDECDTEQGGVASLASLSSSLAGQDGFPSVPANMAHMFQFSSPGVPSASQTQMLPAITFSPDAEGQQNLPTRVYMSSPITMVPMSHDQQDKNHHDHLTSPSPAALALANMSVIDMLLKSHGTELHAAEKSADDLPTSLAKTPAISGHYCVECNNTYKEPCKFHITDYMHLTDTPLLSRARASLPLTLNLQKSSLNGHFSDVGVFCNETVKLRTLLGPLVGKPVPCDMWQSGKKFVFWKIFFEDYFSVLDISDEDESNWLMFVKPARNALEQNLVAFQKDEEIYFVTCKDIEPGQELLFWYAKDYAKLLGLSPKPRRNGTSYCPYCCVCEKVFPDRKSLKLHKKEEHPNLTERKWACQFCHHRFTSSAKLNTHVIALHLHFKPFYCRHCGKQFADQSNLRHHMNIHTGEKKFVCETCQKSFRQKAHLTAHKLVHTGIKALQCQYCSVKFARRSDLKQHEYQHTKEKVYPCSECMKVFYKLQNYNKHVKIHNNERNYHCQHCPKTFVTSYHLKRHLKACKGLKNAAMKMTADADDVLFEDFNDNADDDEDGIARIIADVAPSEGSGVFESGGTRRSQRNVTRINLEET